MSLLALLLWGGGVLVAILAIIWIIDRSIGKASSTKPEETRWAALSNTVQGFRFPRRG
jgi:hypothetical protein